MWEVSFADSEKPPLRLPDGACLSEELTIDNSPILFGCRTGICGTCMIELTAESSKDIHPRTDEENELLEIMAPNRPQCRLACQIRINAHLRIRKANLW